VPAELRSGRVLCHGGLLELAGGNAGSCGYPLPERGDTGRKRRCRLEHVRLAALTLPTGDTVQYPEKVVRYSTSKGYRLKFRRGTNVTSNPPAVDPKAKITIKGLTFVQEGSAWEPTAGEITYQFLGQKGRGNLLDFVR
jgi:hypothetical protein